MPEWPKWVIDALTQTPAYGLAAALAYVAIRWHERKWQGVLDEHKRVSAEEVARLKRDHNSAIRAKNRRIRELERAGGDR